MMLRTRLICQTRMAMVLIQSLLWNWLLVKLRRSLLKCRRLLMQRSTLLIGRRGMMIMLLAGIESRRTGTTMNIRGRLVATLKRWLLELLIHRLGHIIRTSSLLRPIQHKRRRIIGGHRVDSSIQILQKIGVLQLLSDRFGAGIGSAAAVVHQRRRGILTLKCAIASSQVMVACWTAGKYAGRTGHWDAWRRRRRRRDFSGTCVRGLSSSREVIGTAYKRRTTGIVRSVGSDGCDGCRLGSTGLSMRITPVHRDGGGGGGGGYGLLFVRGVPSPGRCELSCLVEIDTDAAVKTGCGVFFFFLFFLFFLFILFIFDFFGEKYVFIFFYFYFYFFFFF